MNNKEIAHQTLQILKDGTYCSPKDREIDLSDELKKCIEQTECCNPEQLDAIRRRQQKISASSNLKTNFEIRNETTLQGSRRLAHEEKFETIGVLNFASARNPGGGFLNGAQAQEESLARSSGLYLSLKECPSYYEYHRSHRSTLYSNRMIWSPGCPVFRTDDGTLLDPLYTVNFITSPAPNAGAVRQNESENISKIEHVLRDRSSMILALAAHHRCEALVLGAWGCGVFRNDPEIVARAFRNHLGRTGAFYNCFQKVMFSVLDPSESEDTIRPFREIAV